MALGRFFKTALLTFLFCVPVVVACGSKPPDENGVGQAGGHTVYRYQDGRHTCWVVDSTAGIAISCLNP